MQRVDKDNRQGAPLRKLVGGPLPIAKATGQVEEPDMLPVHRLRGRPPFTAVRGQGRHCERPNRHDEGPQPINMFIIHGLQTPDLGVSGIRVHHLSQIIQRDICELLLVSEVGHVLVGQYLAVP